MERNCFLVSARHIIWTEEEVSGTCQIYENMLVWEVVIVVIIFYSIMKTFFSSRKQCYLKKKKLLKSNTIT